MCRAKASSVAPVRPWYDIAAPPHKMVPSPPTPSQRGYDRHNGGGVRVEQPFPLIWEVPPLPDGRDKKKKQKVRKATMPHHNGRDGTSRDETRRIAKRNTPYSGERNGVSHMERCAYRRIGPPLRDERKQRGRKPPCRTAMGGTVHHRARHAVSQSGTRRIPKRGTACLI